MNMLSQLEYETNDSLSGGISTTSFKEHSIKKCHLVLWNFVLSKLECPFSRWYSSDCCTLYYSKIDLIYFTEPNNDHSNTRCVSTSVVLISTTTYKWKKFVGVFHKYQWFWKEGNVLFFKSCTQLFWTKILKLPKVYVNLKRMGLLVDP